MNEAARRDSPAEPPVSGTWLADAAAALHTKYLVKGHINAGTSVLIVGESGSGKSFITLDMVVHAALNARWCGHRTAGGFWWYCAREGFNGMLKRAEALKREYPHLARAPVCFDRVGANLSDRSSVEALLRRIYLEQEGRGAVCSGIVFDTLHRSMVGDENTAEAMAPVIANVQWLANLSITTVLIHHLGKDISRGARGHSSLKAAIDSEFTIEQREDVRILRATKQRDLELGSEIAFRLKKVALGLDEDGDEVSSCVVETTGIPFVPVRPTGANQKALLAELERLVTSSNEVGIWTEGELRAIARGLGMQKNAARAAVFGLRDLKYLTPTVGGDRLAFSEGQKDKNGTKGAFGPQGAQGQKGQKPYKGLSFVPTPTPSGSSLTPVDNSESEPTDDIPF